MSFTSLPIELVLDVAQYLSARDFLALTSCNRFLHEASQEPSYWRHLARTTFRIPHQPMLESDGAHWTVLYKRLWTQTRVYTWGSNQKGNLGHVPEMTHGRMSNPLRTTGLPEVMLNLKDVGIVADVQCGGWSTVLLNSRGELYGVGVMNGLTIEMPRKVLFRLEFPPPYPTSNASRYEPSTAIEQYSLGRSRLLGLADDGKIWQWKDFHKLPNLVTFSNTRTVIGHAMKAKGRVIKVLAGWSVASVFIQGVGIAYWDDGTIGNAGTRRNPELDALVIQQETVPGTKYMRDRANEFKSDSLEYKIGEVTNYIILEHHLIFITHLNKIFLWHLSPDAGLALEPTEITPLYSHIDDGKIKDIQGSFRHFAIFTDKGAVLVCTSELIEQYLTYLSDPSPDLDTADLPPPSFPIPLQNSSVISLAFGDYHYHALHADGTVSSHGTEPQNCGALGLGTSQLSILRGVSNRFWAQNGEILIPPWSDGKRTVWFEPEKHIFLTENCQKSATAEAQQRFASATDAQQAVEIFGEWFERAGRNWSSGLDGNDPEPDDNGIEAYFAIKIAAAGWHSAALVLVDPAKAERVRAKYLVSPQPHHSSSTDPTPREHDATTTPAEVAELRERQGQEQSRFSRFHIRLRLLTLHAITRRALTRRMLTQTRALDAESSSSSRNTPAAPVTPQHDVYIWEDMPFPRLKMGDGSEMQGNVELASWKGGEPDFNWRPEGWVEPEEV